MATVEVTYRTEAGRLASRVLRVHGRAGTAHDQARRQVRRENGVPSALIVRSVIIDGRPWERTVQERPQELLPAGTVIEVAHIVSRGHGIGSGWGFGYECQSTWHEHDPWQRPARVTRHYPGYQVCYRRDGDEQEHAVEDRPDHYRVLGESSD